MNWLMDKLSRKALNLLESMLFLVLCIGATCAINYLFVRTVNAASTVTYPAAPQAPNPTPTPAPTPTPSGITHVNGENYLFSAGSTLGTAIAGYNDTVAAINAWRTAIQAVG